MSLRQLLYCILWAYSVAAWLEINLLLTYLRCTSTSIFHVIMTTFLCTLCPRSCHMTRLMMVLYYVALSITGILLTHRGPTIPDISSHFPHPAPTQRRSQDFCLGGGHPVHFPSSLRGADRIQWGGGGVVAEIFRGLVYPDQIQWGGG